MISDNFNNFYSYLKNVLRKGLFAISASFLLSKILGFLGHVIIVRLVSKAEYGVYSYAKNQLDFFLILTGLGALSAILQICSEFVGDEAKADAVYAYGCKIGILFNIILAVPIICWAVFVKLPIRGAERLLALLSLFPLVSILTGLEFSYLRSRLRNNDFARANFISSIFTCLFLVLGAYFFKTQGLIFGEYAACIFTCLSVALIYKVPLWPKSQVQLSDGEKKDFLKIALISMANNGISQLLYLLDIFLIGYFIANEETVAMYKVATSIPGALLILPRAFITFIYPYFAQHRKEKAWVKKNYKYSIWATLIVDGSVSIVLFIIAPWVFRFLYGADYLDAVVPFRILIAGFAFSGTFRTLSGNLLVTQRELKFNFYVALFSGIVNIVADIVLIMKFGSVGAAVATVLVEFLSAAASTGRMFYVLKKQADASLKKGK